MIQALLDYARKLAAEEGLSTEPGFAPKAVRWAAVFSADGRFLQVNELGDAGQKKNTGRTFPKCPELLQPEMKRGGAGCRHFLVDSLDVVALLADDPEDPKLQAKHAYFTNLLRQASEVLPELAAAADALADPAIVAEIRGQLEQRKAKPTERMTVAFLDDKSRPRFPVEHDAWHDWWRGFRRSLGTDDDGTGEAAPSRRKAAPAGPAQALCLGTGLPVEPAATHPKIAGLADVGGLAMGDALISFKQEAFGSYGLEQSANAPMSEEVAAAYRAGLNDLIRKYGRALAGAKVVPWFKTRVATELNPFAWILDDPALQKADAQARARELLDAIAAGKRPDLAGNHYYVLTLSGAAGRVMVRDWMEGDFPTLLSNVEDWFGHLAIVRRDGEGLAPPPKFLAVVGALARELDDVPRPLQASLFRAAVLGQPIPRQAMAQALQRFKLDALQNETFKHTQVSLLKAYLIRIRKEEPPMATHLDENHPHPAYHCGRLMAMYAALQYRALGDVGAGVVQRYFASAIATPALVLGRLARNAQFHLDKLDRGLARWHEGRIADAWGNIRDGKLPATLDLEEQSLFALGYYQQIAADRQRTQSAAADNADAPEPTPTQETTAHV